MKTTSQILPPFARPVNAKYGAPMGRPRQLPGDLGTVRALSMSFVPFTDGDYDAGGAYWGGGKDSLPLFCFWGYGVEMYHRAESQAAALEWARILFPDTPITQTGLSDFARAYVEAALWLMSEDDEGSKTVDDLDRGTLYAMAKDADRFALCNRALIDLAGLADSRAGFCFWLSRNGHGSGYFDEADSRAPVEVVNACDRLQEAARKAGGRDLYRGDDGKIYQE